MDEDIYYHDNHIWVIGAGCGERTLTLEAAERIRDAELIIGSRRLLAYSIVQENPCKKYEAYMAPEIIDIIKHENKSRTCVLFSGDTGFYSGAAKLCDALRDERYLLTEVIPGISSVGMMASILQEPYDDAAIHSYHGRPIDPAEVISIVSEHEKSYFLLSGKNDLIQLSDILHQTDLHYEIDVGCDFNGENDRITVFSEWDDLSDAPEGRLYIAVVEKL